VVVWSKSSEVNQFLLLALIVASLGGHARLASGADE
jgi:hypothetical protein